MPVSKCFSCRYERKRVNYVVPARKVNLLIFGWTLAKQKLSRSDVLFIFVPVCARVCVRACKRYGKWTAFKWTLNIAVILKISCIEQAKKNEMQFEMLHSGICPLASLTSRDSSRFLLAIRTSRFTSQFRPQSPFCHIYALVFRVCRDSSSSDTKVFRFFLLAKSLCNDFNLKRAPQLALS